MEKEEEEEYFFFLFSKTQREEKRWTCLPGWPSKKAVSHSLPPPPAFLFWTDKSTPKQEEEEENESERAPPGCDVARGGASRSSFILFVLLPFICKLKCVCPRPFTDLYATRQYLCIIAPSRLCTYLPCVSTLSITSEGFYYFFNRSFGDFFVCFVAIIRTL